MHTLECEIEKLNNDCQRADEKTQEIEAVMSDKSDLIQTVLSRTRAQKCLS